MSTAKRQNIALKIFLSSGGSGSGSVSGGSGNPKQHRFLVVDVYQIVLVQPDATRLGWGVATFVGFLQVWLIFFCNSSLFELATACFHEKCSTKFINLEFVFRENIWLAVQIVLVQPDATPWAKATKNVKKI